MGSAELSPGTLLGEHIEILSHLRTQGAVRQMLARHVGERRDLLVHAFELGRGAGVAELRERAAGELSNAVSVEHPTMPRWRSCGELGGVVYLVEESPHGETLRTRLEISPQGLSGERVLQHTRALLELLEEAHEHGAYHADLRPEVMMLVPDASGGESLRVLELGLIQATEAVRRINPLKLGARGRRSAFQPPEEGNGRKPPSSSSDLYATGMLMLVMLTGKPASKLSPRALPEDIPDTLKPLLQKALARDPTQRFTSARAFLDALGEVVAGVVAGPSTEVTASRFASESAPKPPPSDGALEQRFSEELALLKEIERDFVPNSGSGLQLDFAEDSLSSISGGERLGRHSLLGALEMEMAELESERKFEQEATRVYKRDGATAITMQEKAQGTAVTRRPMVERPASAAAAAAAERKESTLIARRPLAAPEVPDHDLTDLEGVAALRVEGGTEGASATVESTSLTRNPFLLVRPDAEEESADAPAEAEESAEAAPEDDGTEPVESVDEQVASVTAAPDEDPAETEDDDDKDEEPAAAVAVTAVAPIPTRTSEPQPSTNTWLPYVAGAALLLVLIVVVWAISSGGEGAEADASPAQEKPETPVAPVPSGENTTLLEAPSADKTPSVTMAPVRPELAMPGLASGAVNGLRGRPGDAPARAAPKSDSGAKRIRRPRTDEKKTGTESSTPADDFLKMKVD